MRTKEQLGKVEIEALRILVSHLRDVDCYQEPEGIKSDLINLANQLYNLTLEPMSKIKVNVQGGVAYCDDPRVEIIDHDYQ